MCAETPEYKVTLNLPKTDFPMRAGLPKREPAWLERWAEMGVYDRCARKQGRVALHAARRPSLCERASAHRSRAEQNHQGYDRALATR